MRRSHTIFGWSLFALAAGACTSVIGIEELEEGPRPGSTGGRDTTGGRSESGGSAGRAETGGSSTGGAPASTGGRSDSGGTGGAQSTGGSPSAAGESPGGETGEGGSGEPAPSTVEGKVIDFWGRPVPNVPVGIGDLTAATASDGTFTIEGVTPPYDVSLLIDNERLNYAWVYQGISRLDPTLQVEVGLPDRSNTTTFYLDNATFGGDNVVAVSVGGPDSSYALKPSGGQLTTFPTWSGPTTIEVTAHGLWWTETDTDTMPGPASFESYATSSSPISFVASMPAEVRLDLSPVSVQSVRVQGTVVRSIDDSPNLSAYVRFPDTAAIELFSERVDSANFVFTAPEIPDAAIVAVGSHGNPFDGPYGVAGEAFDGGGITITPPEPVALISPATDAVNVGPSTTFEWTKKPGALVLHIEDSDLYQGIYVVTMGTKITIPEVVGGFTLRAGAGHSWTVETHGTAETMDEVTGPEGFLDPLSYDWETPRGPKHGSPSFSFAQRRTLQTAP